VTIRIPLMHPHAQVILVMADQYKQERDESRAELERIRGELNAFTNEMKSATDRLQDTIAGPTLARITRRLESILAPVVSHQEDTGNADT
jgi:hypothetical protein